MLSSIVSKGSGLPNRYIIYGVEGIGKTSFGAQFPGVVFLMTKGETGLETLIDAGMLPDTQHFPEASDWNLLMAQLKALRDEKHDHKTVVIDTVNGAERLCHEMVCERDFKADWGKEGFTGYNRGFEVALADWRELLSILDDLQARKMTVVLLAHSNVRPFKNPVGDDFDRYTVAMHQKTWDLTHRWADCVLFMNFETLKIDGRKGSGQLRLMFTVRHAAYDAKNRLGLPEVIDLGESFQQAFSNFRGAFQEAKQRTKQGATS